MEDPPTQNKGKAAIIIASFKTMDREKLRTLADLNIWIIAVVFI